MLRDLWVKGSVPSLYFAFPGEDHMVESVKISTAWYCVLCVSIPGWLLLISQYFCVFCSLMLPSWGGLWADVSLCIFSPCYDAPDWCKLPWGHGAEWRKKISLCSLKSNDQGHLHLLSWHFYTGFCNLFLNYLCFSAISSNKEAKLLLLA